MDWTALGLALGAFLLSAGGIIVYVKVLQGTVNDMKQDIREHESRLNNHDVIFESISVNQKYILEGINEMKTDLKDLKDEHKEQFCKD